MADENVSIASFHTVAPAEIGEVVRKALAENDADLLEAWTSLFRNRALRLIRTGSTTELRDESSNLNRHLYAASGRALLGRNPTAYARFQMIAEMLSEAAQRTDTVFLSSVLASHNKYARPMLEMLSRGGPEGVPRQEILERLKIPSESYLSHILADFEKADLIVRLRRVGSKGVTVTLGAAGRDLVHEKLLPQWFLSVVDILGNAATSHVAPSRARVATILEESHSPSKLITDHVVGLLMKITGRRPPEDGASEHSRMRADR